jgi:hypothetical protein
MATPVTLPGYQGTGFKFENKTIGDIIGGTGGLLAYVYVFAGLGLLIFLIAGGLTLMTAAGDQNKTKKGFGMISSALIGFAIIFVSYFVVQLVQVILKVKIL